MTVGTRVQLHPATDQWMQGDRYGVIERVTASKRHPSKICYWVRLNSGRLCRYHPGDINVVPN